jgi:hypothetical protein
VFLRRDNSPVVIPGCATFTVIPGQPAGLNPEIRDDGCEIPGSRFQRAPE